MSDSSSPVRQTTATFDHYPAEYTRRRSSAASSGNGTLLSSSQRSSSIRAYSSGAHAVHCHQCGSIFVISNTCSNCNHRQCKDCL